MSVAEQLARLGGVACARDLVAATSKRAVKKAVTNGSIIKLGRGRYAVPAADEAVRTAHRLHAVLSLTSAALHHGWEVQEVPTSPHVTVSRHRKLTPAQRSWANVHRAELADSEVDGGATSVRRTLTDCLRNLPFAEALCVADSALRHRAVTQAELVALTAALRGPGSRAAQRVAALASARAANPFESTLRALAIEAGLDVEPQVPIGGDAFLGRPDLVDRGRRLVLEADSFEWHGTRQALLHDARRYNGFVAAGWRVLRFCWEDVMHAPELVLEVLRSVADERTERLTCAGCAA